MNVLEQLQALGFEEEPLQFYDGGDTGDVGDGTGDGGQGPGGTDVGAENTADYGGPGLGPGGTELSSEISSTAGGTGRGTVSIAGPVSPESPEVLASYAAGRLSNFDWGSPQGKEAASILSQLADLGYGKMEGLNVANPSQSVDNLLASANTAQFGVPLALSVIPGANFALNAAKTFGALAEGKASVGQTIANTAISIAASQLGVPASTAMAMVNGEFGKAAANTAMGAITGVVSNITGLPSGLVTAGLSLTGAGKSISDTIAQTVNEAFSGSGAGTAGATGQGFAFGDSGQLGFDASNLNTASLAPEVGGSATAMPYSSGALNTLGALGALGVLSPRQETESSKRYQTAQVPAESPFGLMYGMRG